VPYPAATPRHKTSSISNADTSQDWGLRNGAWRLPWKERKTRRSIASHSRMRPVWLIVFAWDNTHTCPVLPGNKHIVCWQIEGKVKRLWNPIIAREAVTLCDVIYVMEYVGVGHHYTFRLPRASWREEQVSDRVLSYLGRTPLLSIAKFRTQLFTSDFSDGLGAITVTLRQFSHFGANRLPADSSVIPPLRVGCDPPKMVYGLKSPKQGNYPAVWPFAFAAT